MKIRERLARLVIQHLDPPQADLDPHPPPPELGYVKAGDLLYRIRWIAFADGMMHINAEAGIQQSGEHKGQAVVVGPDGLGVVKTQNDHYLGVKTTGSTWLFDMDLRLPAEVQQVMSQMEGTQ
jgi:hypothetical protein